MAVPPADCRCAPGIAPGLGVEWRDHFVAVQNTHDEKAVTSLLLDSPEFLWITRGTAVWGRGPAMKRFAALYQGTWQLAPDPSELKVMMSGEGSLSAYRPD